MDPLSVSLAASATAEAAAVQVPLAAEGALGTEATFGELSELQETVLGEQGLLDQLDTIQSIPLESLEESNRTLLSTRNSELAGTTHPETGVPFETDTIVLRDGSIIEGVFPEFDPVFDWTMPEELDKASDYQQAKACNEKLREAIENDPELRSRFTEEQLEQIRNGETPDGYTWHHHQQPGRMQLVDTEIHMKTGHTGGKEIWGGGR